MYRDKIITIRVSSKLLKQVQERIDSYTTTYTKRGNRKGYETKFPNQNKTYEKYSIADLLEKALIKFIEEVPERSPGAK